MQNKSKNLRQSFQTKSILRIVGAHHALGAQLIERHGFDGVWASGLEISASHGVPDANILTMTDNLLVASSINGATHLPVVCDCDTGYGNASNVIHMVKKYEAAGIAAVVIEDKLFPKVNSFIPGRQELASIEEFMGKIEAAKTAQANPDFMVFARVEALIAGWGMEEALRRAYAYSEAGADGIVIHSKQSTPDEVFEFSKKWNGNIPLVVIPTMFPNVTSDVLAQNRFKMVIYANQGLRASVKAMDETFKAIAQEKSTATVENKIASMKEIFELQGMFNLKEDEKKFDRRESIEAIIPAAGDHESQAGLKNILNGKPISMLLVGGKPLIERQVGILRAAGVKDVCVIGGKHFDQIKVEAQIRQNADYASTRNVGTIMLAKDFLKKNCLISYSDIIFDQQIVEYLLDSPYPVTLVIDRAYKTLPARDKKLDLVQVSEPAQAATSRRLDANIFKPILKVGQQLDKSKATHEFIGLLLVKEKGIEALSKLWKKDIDVNEWVQAAIDQGVEVRGMEIEHGWSEIHSEEDYRRVDSYFLQNTKK